MAEGVRKTVKLILAAVLTYASLVVSLAYESQFADAGGKIPLRWKSGATITLAVSNSLKQTPNINPGSDVAGAIERSLATWEQAANIKLNFIWTDKTAINAANSEGDGISLLTIAAAPENLASFAGEASELAGRTRVFFTKRGAISEADIALNPYQKFSTDGSADTFDLQATITHEIGHLLGLSHTDVLGATMHPQQGKNGIYGLPAFAPRTLSDDDRAGIRSLYGAKTDVIDCCGSIAGTLTRTSGKPLANLTIWAENEADGRLIATSKTNETGAYNFAGLPAGNYRLFAQSSEAGKASAVKIGSVEVESDAGATLSRAVSFPPKTFNFRLVGFNGQLSTVAVPVNAGRSYMIFVGGDFTAEDLAGVETSSPLLSVVSASLAPQDYGSEASVLSFQVNAAENTPKGEYSLILRRKNGEMVYLLGALTVDDVQNGWQSRFIGE
ncbi:MAG: carboxypeptidase regulatory-like domain-containing protein [Acidobacteriota bacterium]|nr:carboxypeptidase regulatory-like domain-containing protein [Acidobacteriota bacterium]